MIRVGRKLVTHAIQVVALPIVNFPVNYGGAVLSFECSAPGRWLFLWINGRRYLGGLNDGETEIQLIESPPPARRLLADCPWRFAETVALHYSALERGET